MITLQKVRKVGNNQNLTGVQIKSMEENDRLLNLKAMLSAKRSIEGLLTIVVKTYVCHPSIRQNAEIPSRSIRAWYPHVKILLGNDGPLKFRSELYKMMRILLKSNFQLGAE